MLTRTATRQIRGCISNYQALPLMFGSTLNPPVVLRRCGDYAHGGTSAGCTIHSPSPQVPSSGGGSSLPSAYYCLLVLEYQKTPRTLRGEGCHGSIRIHA